MTLPLPVRRATREAFDNVAVEHTWRGISARRARSSSPRARGILLVAAALAMALAVLLVNRRPTPPIPDSGPLRLSEGTTLAPLAVPLTAEDEPRHYDLSDGSRLDLSSGTSFAPRENSGALFLASLRGNAKFDVRHGGPRRWTIDCGLAKVEVVGTRFEIQARPDRVHVRVERGRVRVTSADRAIELGAGESTEVVVASPNRGLGPASAPPPPAPPPPPPEKPVLDHGLDQRGPDQRSSGQRGAWQDLARKGEYSAAYDQLGAPGIARATPRATVDELLTLADVARLSGHAADAVAPLTRAFSENPTDARAALAAFTLGRIELDTLGHPSRAATAFSRAIALGLPGGLVEDGHARLVEALAKAGDRPGAKTAFDAYTRAFPAGNRSTTMRRWLGDTNDEGPSAPSPSPSSY